MGKNIIQRDILENVVVFKGLGKYPTELSRAVVLPSLLFVLCYRVYLHKGEYKCNIPNTGNIMPDF